MLQVSRTVVVLYGLIMGRSIFELDGPSSMHVNQSDVQNLMIQVAAVNPGALSCALNVAGIDLNWLYLLMGLLIGPAVPPVSFCLTWRKATRAGAVGGALSGIVTGLLAWLIYAKVRRCPSRVVKP